MAAQPEELRGRPIKYIYIVSDSTGFTASHALTSCMTQFEDIIVDWNGEHEGQEPPEEAGRMEVRTQMFSNVKDWGRLDRIIQLAAKMDAFVVYTLVDPQLNARMVEKAQQLKLHCEDLLGPLVTTVSEYLDQVPSGRPRFSTQERRKPLSDKYFRRIEAVEFTIKHDDGNLPENFYNADIVLLGVSRTGKTPLSTYLAQQFGYKMGNVPIVHGVEMVQAILDVDPRKVFGLTMSPTYLKRIRSRRLSATGVDKKSFEEGGADYDSLRFIAKEVAWGQKLYAECPQWVVLDVTGRSVEENSAIITELLSSTGKSTPVEEALNKARSHVFIVAVTNPETGVTCAALPTLMISQGLIAAATGKHSDAAVLHTVADIANKISMAPAGDEAGVSGEEMMMKAQEGIPMLMSALEKGVPAAVRVKARLSDDVLADSELCVARCQPLYDDDGAVTHVICTVAAADRIDSPIGKSAGASEAVEEAAWQHSDLGYVQDGDAFLRQVVGLKARLFASDDKVAARIAEFAVDAEGPEYRIRLVSQAFADSLQLTAAELVGQPLWSLFGENSDKHTISMIRDSLAQGQAISTAVLVYDKGRKATWRHVYFQPVLGGADPQPALFVGVQLL
eukprot:Tamp_08261.p1 GENE.Tamp_08261~~Tamp_08261.p1  ORF type:complete len:722 (+),score=171.18 Tamp_08261:310-2166(+)